MEKKYYWLINICFTESSAGDVYIADTLEDAEAHRMDYCSWYCNPGDVTLRKVDQKFNEVERIDYFKGKVIEHVIYERDDIGRLIKAYSKIKNGRKVKKS